MQIVIFREWSIQTTQNLFWVKEEGAREVKGEQTTYFLLFLFLNVSTSITNWNFLYLVSKSRKKRNEIKQSYSSFTFLPRHEKNVELCNFLPKLT